MNYKLNSVHTHAARFVLLCRIVVWQHGGVLHDSNLNRFARIASERIDRLSPPANFEKADRSILFFSDGTDLVKCVENNGVSKLQASQSQKQYRSIRGAKKQEKTTIPEVQDERESVI